MTETTAQPGPAAGPYSARPLVRDPDQRMVAGVCAAVGRYTDTDPVIWRVVTAVLTVFGGAGLVLYLLGWLLIPKTGQDAGLAQRWLRRDNGISPVAVGVLAVVAVLLFAGLDDGDGVAAVGVLALVGYLVHRERQGRPVAPSYVPPADAGDWTAPPAEPPAPRPPSRLGSITLSVTALVTGVLILARAYGVESLTPSRIVAAALVVVGAGLVVGTWYGRARWLAFIGLLLCLALAATAAADATNGPLRGGIGERTWTPNPSSTSQGFRLGVGEATLDLTNLPADGPHVTIDAHIGAGHLIVLVDDDVPVRMHAEVQVGELREFGETLGDGADRIERTRSYGPSGDPRVELDATVGAGQVEVRRG